MSTEYEENPHWKPIRIWGVFHSLHHRMTYTHEPIDYFKTKEEADKYIYDNYDFDDRMKFYSAQIPAIINISGAAGSICLFGKMIKYVP